MRVRIDKIIFSLVFSLLIVGCSKEVLIDLPKKEGSLVVESEFTNLPNKLTIEEAIAGVIHPQYIPSKFKINKSAPIFESPSQNLSNYIVKIFKNNDFLYEAAYNEEDETYIMFKEEQDYPLPGDIIGFELLENGELLSEGKSMMPSLVKIDAIDTLIFAFVGNNNSTLNSKGSITFTDPKDEENYYEIVIGEDITSNDPIITSEKHYPSVYQQDFFKNESLLFTDKSFNGEQKTIDFFFPIAIILDNQVTVYFQNVYFELRNVTKEYYDFKTSKRIHLLLGQDDLLFGTAEPSEITSNIKNGYGLFGAFTHSQKGISIPQRTYNL